MVLQRINRVSGAREYNRSSSTGNLENLYQYERKQQRVRPDLERAKNDRGGSQERSLYDQYTRSSSAGNLENMQQQVRPGLERTKERGGSQRFNGLVESYLASNGLDRRSNSVKDLKTLFDVNDGHSNSNKDMSASALRPSLSRSKLSSPRGLGDPDEEAAISSTANATFNLAPAPTIKLSPEIMVLKKRMAELQQKLKNQETRHIQDRLTWKAQSVELQRLRRDRDQLLEDQATQREQLKGTQFIAEAIMAENKQLRADFHALQPEVSNVEQGVDWEKKLIELLQERNEKDQKIGALAAQLHEKNDQLQQETDANTAFIMGHKDFIAQLQETERDLQRQSSSKDLRINILNAELEEMAQQLQKETDLNTEIVGELRANESNLRRESSQKDLAIGQLMEELNQSRSKLEMHMSQNDLSFHILEFSQQGLTVENLTVELNESRGSIAMDDLMSGGDRAAAPRDRRAMDPKWIQKIEETQDQLKKELESAKKKTLKTLERVRTKLVEERTKVRRYRQKLEEMKRVVAHDNLQAVAVISGLRNLIERMEGKILSLEEENEALRTSANEQ